MQGEFNTWKDKEEVGHNGVGKSLDHNAAVTCEKREGNGIEQGDLQRDP